MTLLQHHIEYLDALFEAAKEATPENKKGEFTEWHAGFMEDNCVRYREYGAETRFSLKQWDVLFDIGAKLGVADPR